jgi:hypothetical protein
MDQSEIFLYSLKPSALNYDWPPKFLVAKEKKIPKAPAKPPKHEWNTFTNGVYVSHDAQPH